MTRAPRTAALMGPLRPQAVVGALLAALILLAAATLDAQARKSGGTRAKIFWTDHHVPHVRAGSWSGLGFGYGYAFATDNLCTLAEDVVTVNGQRSRFFGPDGTYVTHAGTVEHNNLKSDFYYALVKERRVVHEALKRKPPRGPSRRMRKLVGGYVAGYNKYLRKTGVKHLPDPRCRGEEWVRPLTGRDIWLRAYELVIASGSDLVIDNIVDATPPGRSERAPSPDAVSGSGIHRAFEIGETGSNAIALGGDATANGRGMVLGNPHLPWRGPERLYQAQLTIPGALNVSGASVFGMPMIAVGHTRGLAWSDTTSAALRFTPYELRLAPGNPTAYVVDGRVEAMTAQDVSVKTRSPAGELEDASHTFYLSRFGPVFELADAGLEWSSQAAFAFADANATNFRAFDQFLAIDRAQGIGELERALDRWQGVPYLNTLAADSKGRAYYADASVVPNVSDAQLDRCLTPIGGVALETAGVPILDGSRADCGWARDPDAIEPGIIGPGNLPRLARADYVQNSNGSYWLTNPEQPLEGLAHSVILGGEREEQTLRTRLGIKTIQDRLAGSDGFKGTKFTVTRLMSALLQNRNLSAELARVDVARMCREQPIVAVDGARVDVSEACTVLEGWDGRGDLASRGEALWQEFWSRADDAWTTPFDPDDPVDTPNTLDVGAPEVRAALGAAVQELRDRGIPLNAEWGSVQFAPDADIPIPGCSQLEGCYNSILNQPLATEPAKLRALAGSTWIMAAGFTRHGPRARTVLTHSQSENPRSRFHADQTKLFSRGRTIHERFSRREILSDPRLKTRVLRTP
jgi:acyl-homoserine-lactone acylase